MAATKWTVQQIPSQAGKTALVTGANSGIGYQAARQLAIHGAHVVLACRNADKARIAVDALEKELDRSSLEILPLDLSDQFSVRHAAEAFLSRRPQATALLTEIGLDTELTHPTSARASILAGGALRSIPPKTFLGVPASADAATTRI